LYLPLLTGSAAPRPLWTGYKAVD